MKVTASPVFNTYRNAVLGLGKKDFRDLQKGKVVSVDKETIDVHPFAFIEVKEAKHGSTKHAV